MQCPTDGSTLVMSERSGVEIDYCPTCRGVWLDRGELDKILDRAAAESSGVRGAAPTGSPLDGGYATAAPGYGTTPNADPGYGRGHDNRGYDNRGYDNRGYDDRRDGDRKRDGYGRDGRRKRESWLSDLFD